MEIIRITRNGLMCGSGRTSSSARLILSACVFWLALYRFQSHSQSSSSSLWPMQNRRRTTSRLLDTTDENNAINSGGGGRLLYIITSMRMLDSGRRETIRGYDRFSQTIIPIVRESTKSLLMDSPDYINHVDVYLITFYPVNETRRQELRQALPNSVGLEIWQEAAPLFYDYQNGKLRNEGKAISSHTRGLSRQHRFVVKDKLSHYDYFVVMEDDMLIHGAQMQNYIEITNQLYRLRTTTTNNATTRNTPKTNNPRHHVDANHDFYGPMTSKMLERTIPGWFRVEAALPGWKPHDMNLYENIPIDYDWNILNNSTTTKSSHMQIKELDPSYCCHVENETANEHIPYRPTIADLYFWETSIDALGVRKFPTIMEDDTDSSSSSKSSFFDWALLLVGTTEGWAREAAIHDYWAGRDGYFYGKHGEGNIRPPGTKGRYMNNQGGWTATRRQVIEWHSNICAFRSGGFLPPYDKPGYQYDGLAAESVEYWSGGQQLASGNGCNIMRIIPLEPSMFERQLLYHSSNNKQRQENVQHRYSSRNIQEFWGQLNTVRKNAERAILRHQQEIQTPNKGMSPSVK